MKKVSKCVLSCTVAIGAILPSSVSASATTYKIVKNKLVNAKTNAVIKGKVVYKQKLYKNGKLVTETAKYKGKYYVKGKQVKSTQTFTYNYKLYKGNALYKGFKLFEYVMYKDGKPFTGVYKQTFYNEGSAVDNAINGTVLQTSTSTAYIIAKPKVGFTKDYTLDASNVVISKGAVVDSAKVDHLLIDDYHLRQTIIKVSNLKADTTYDISLNGVSVGNEGKINLKDSFTTVKAFADFYIKNAEKINDSNNENDILLLQTIHDTLNEFNKPYNKYLIEKDFF